jgi:hypothetical protein
MAVSFFDFLGRQVADGATAALRACGLHAVFFTGHQRFLSLLFIKLIHPNKSSNI